MYKVLDQKCALMYISSMQTNTNNQSGLKLKGGDLKKEVTRSPLTREKLVSLIQDEGFSFSITGLDRMFRGELPAKDTEHILLSLAKHLGCPISNFVDWERKTA
jgi:hypothetical protein